MFDRALLCMGRVMAVHSQECTLGVCAPVDQKSIAAKARSVWGRLGLAIWMGLYGIQAHLSASWIFSLLVDVTAQRRANGTRETRRQRPAGNGFCSTNYKSPLMQGSVCRSFGPAGKKVAPC